MKKSVTVLAVAGAFTYMDAALAQAISRVTLYPGSATIERTAKVQPGIGKLQMSGLPANFDPRTIRVETDAGIHVGEVTVQDVSRAEAVGKREADLEERIQKLRDEKAALDVDVKTAELVRDYLKSLKMGTDDPKAPRAYVDAKSIPAVLEAIRRGGADSYGTLQKMEIRKRELDKRIAVLTSELGRIRSGAREERTLTIAYTAQKPGELRAAYLVHNAGWKPQYRAALDSNTSKVELERQAAVMQRTGEDWRNVKLRLSTGQPRASAIVEPNTWQLVIRPPVQPAPVASDMAREYAASAAMKARGDRAEAAVARAPVEAPPPIVEFNTEYTTEFDVPGTVDLTADGRNVTVSLAKQQIAVKQRVRVVPRRDTAAMVTAEADFPEGVWIPGDVQLYRDGGYIGSTYWQAQAKERMVLPFGRDDRVQVAVKRTKDRKGSAGILSQKSERQVAALYTVTSRHKVPVELLVLEAAPVPVDDKIGVESVFEPKPKTANWEDHKGVHAWEEPLAPGQTLKFVADYTITYPKDVAIVGLP